MYHNNPAYAPPGESSLTLFSERAWLQGAILTGVAYGAEATIFFITFRLLLAQAKGAGYKKAVSFLIYTTLMFIMGTLIMVTAMAMTQISFIDQRNFPGGPAAFETDEFSIPIDALANVCYTIANWFADALLLWRCYVIYKGCHVPIQLIMFFPCLIFAGSFAIGIMFQIQISASSPWGATSNINFTIPYYSLSLGLNVITCLAIAGRLMYYRWRIGRTLGSAHGAQYTSIAAMIIESSALLSAFSICILTTFALNNPIQNLFFQVTCQVQIIAPFLIIYRVASGHAWGQTTASDILSSTPSHGPPSSYSKYSSSPNSASAMMRKRNGTITTHLQLNSLRTKDADTGTGAFSLGPDTPQTISVTVSQEKQTDLMGEYDQKTVQTYGGTTYLDMA